MKKSRGILVCLLVLALAFSTASVSGATAGVGKSTKSNKMKITLTTISRTSIKLKWPKQKKSTHYDIYRKAAGEKTYQKIASVKGTSYLDKKLQDNAMYGYKVRPYRYIKGKKSYGKYSSVNTAAAGVDVSDYTLELVLPSDGTKGAGVNSGTADCSTNKKMAIIYRSTSEDGVYEKIKELPFEKSWSLWQATYGQNFVDQDVDGGADYYYRIKIRKTVGKKSYYSAMSTAKSIRTMPDWTMNTLTYSNLYDEETRAEVSEMLRRAGIKGSWVDEVLALSKDYNDLVGKQPYFHDSFTTIKSRGIDYEAVDTYRLWTENRQYADVNCRLTAMTLFRDFITAEKTLPADNFLSADTDAMENYTLCKIKGAAKDKFYTLYHPVSVKKTTDSAEILAAVQKEWKNRGVAFKTGNVSLISVICHDEMDQIAFVGHAGVMIQDGSDVYFVEKYGPTLPYQTAKFQSRDQVKEYLLNRFWNFYTPGISVPPVIMANDQAL